MKKYITGICLTCIFCILLNIAGCRILKGKTEYTIFSDQNREVSFVGGTDKSLIGIVLDKRELILYDDAGKEKWKEVYEQDIQSFDVLYDCVLLTFVDNHIEEFRLKNEKKEMLSTYMFSHQIDHAEFTDREDTERPVCTVLLTDGEMFVNSSDDLSSFLPIGEGIVSFSYDIYSNLLLYCTEKGNISYLSFYGYDYSFDESLAKLDDILGIEEASLDSYNEEDIRFLVTSRGGDHFVGICIDSRELFLCELVPGEIRMLDVSKSTPKGMLYSKNGKIYYEGPSYNERTYYGVKYREHYLVSIPDGHNSHVIQGGVVYYNDHEVKVKLIP
ncbi:MAG: hypothetical protein K6A81_11700 [Clostridiales bacterium]|nr:hypothetical protein [Clostridiales bacterium]